MLLGRVSVAVMKYDTLPRSNYRKRSASGTNDKLGQAHVNATW
jgi:hypothetical protein